MKKYLCINCKKEFDKLPPIIKNECSSGYYHKFVKSSYIIPDNKRKFDKEIFFKSVEDYNKRVAGSIEERRGKEAGR